MQSVLRINVRLSPIRKNQSRRQPLHIGLNDVGTDIRSHNQNRILEVDSSALIVGKTTIIQHLQKNVEHIRMSLLDLIKQHHRIRLAAYCLSQLATLIITHISRRRTYKTAYRVTLLILAHIDTRHHILIIEEELRQGLGKLCLSYSGSTHEQERSDRPLLVLQTRT